MFLADVYEVRRRLADALGGSPDPCLVRVVVSMLDEAARVSNEPATTVRPAGAGDTTGTQE
jgi:hypothetical protein